MQTATPSVRRPLPRGCAQTIVAHASDYADRSYTGILQTAGGLQLWLAIVTDGFGEHGLGQQTAQLTIDTILEFCRLTRMANVPEILSKAIQVANLRVCEVARRNPSLPVSSTAVIAAIADNRLYVANVGNSRVYLVRGQQMIQLTIDHTLAHENIQSGHWTSIQALRQPNAEQLTRSVGFDRRGIDVDLGLYLHRDKETAGQARQQQGLLLSPSDILLVCSDGLLKPAYPGPPVVMDNVRTIIQNNSIENAARRLIALAQQRHLQEDATVVVIEMPGRALPTMSKISGSLKWTALAAFSGIMLCALAALGFRFLPRFSQVFTAIHTPTEEAAPPTVPIASIDITRTVSPTALPPLPSASFTRPPTLVLTATLTPILYPTASLTSLPSSTALPEPTLTTVPEFTKWDLWVDGPHLRGANIYQRRVYPELDGPTYMGPGPVGPPFIQSDFDRLSTLGANYVNISHPGLFSEQPPYELDTNIQKNLDQLLEMLAQADLFAVISFRTGPGRSEFAFFWGEDGDWFSEDYYNNTIWEDEAAQEAWADMWQYTAERYRDHPIVVGYDLMVEPNSNEVGFEEWNPEIFYSGHTGDTYDWNQLAARTTTAIREVDSATPILIGGNAYSSVEWLPYVQPTGDLHTVYTVHQYEPYLYTHQEPPRSASTSFTYPGNFDTNYDDQPDAFDRVWLENLLSLVDDFAAGHTVPVACNEYGLVRWVPDAAAYMNDLMGLFEQRGMNYALWAWSASWPEWAADDTDFNFLYGGDPENRQEIDNDLQDVIRQYWSRNRYRPSNLQFLP